VIGLVTGIFGLIIIIGLPLIEAQHFLAHTRDNPSIGDVYWKPCAVSRYQEFDVRELIITVAGIVVISVLISIALA